MLPREWDILSEIEAGRSVLLEASAGTGKTYQIASLVLRLVVEFEVPIERILTLTFTNAATAELRDRVRRRLEGAREVLSGAAPVDLRDAVMASLAAVSKDALDSRLGRVEAALASFDLAPISTIHGFSQSMLGLFAFESGQESGLELIEDADETLEQMVDDALAWAHVEQDGRTVELMQALGWKRKDLLAIARRMTAAVEPRLVPDLSGDLEKPRAELVTQPAAMLVSAEAFRHWWKDPEGGGQLLKLLLAEQAQKRFKGSQSKWFSGDYGKIAKWLQSGPFERDLEAKDHKRLIPEYLAIWSGPGKVTEQPFYELVTRLQEFFENRDKMLRETRPLLVFAHGLRERVTAELARRRRLTFDSMLSLLADAVRRDGPDGALARGIRDRFDVALVDEFQDTDASQWAVLDAVFGHGVPGKRMFLIGDPKQAIYAFRGADVFVYLAAAKSADARSTMTTNWRSDGDYVEAMNALWQAGQDTFELPAEDGRAGIDYVEVKAHAPGWRVSGLPGVERNHGTFYERRPFEVRWFDARKTWEQKCQFGSKSRAERHVAKAVAAEALALLQSGALLGVGEGARPIAPGDIAVLVMKNAQAKLIKRELEAVFLPAVVGASGSVLGTSAAGWLVKWLDAVAAGGGDRPARVLATTPMFGWTAEDLASALGEAGGAGGAGRWTAWCDAVARWSREFERRGFIGVFEASLGEYEVMARVAGMPDGERHATDLRHLAELAHLEAKTRDLGPAELAAWLRAEAPDNPEKAERSEERSQRLESDARAIQVTTVHSSKGLEYPIVLLPFSYEEESVEEKGPLLWHDPAHAEQPILDLRHESDPERQAAVFACAREVRQERARLLYVALTRAVHHTVVWFGPAGSGGNGFDGSALGRLLMRSDPGIKFGKPDGDDDNFARVTAALDEVSARSVRTIGWGVGGPQADGESGAEAEHELGGEAMASAVAARVWTGRSVLMSERMVSSFTKLSKRLETEDEEPELEAAPVVVGATDEADTGVSVAMDEGLDGPEEPEDRDVLPEASRLSELEGLWGGKAVGTWVHGVLEKLDFTTGQGKLGEPVMDVAKHAATRAGVAPPEDQVALVLRNLGPIMSTPIGGDGVAGLGEGVSLSSLEVRDRLDELRFDLRVEASRSNKGLPELLADAMRLRLGEDWAGRGWVEQVTRPGGAPLLEAQSGVLVGSIDLVFRVRDEDGETRYFISDFKTNRILSRKEPRGSQRRHYAPQWMAWEMGRHAYHLQALIYTVALHRFLRLRVRDYDYDRHVGGHVYLFLRGMEGPQTPTVDGMRLGVFRDRWPRDVVMAVDAALDAGLVGGVS